MAAFARRVILFRDGRVVEDRTQEPMDAAALLVGARLADKKEHA
jgi:hypothetical protein